MTLELLYISSYASPSSSSALSLTLPNKNPTNFSDYLITSLSVMLKKAPRHEGKSKGENIVVLPPLL